MINHCTAAVWTRPIGRAIRGCTGSGGVGGWNAARTLVAEAAAGTASRGTKRMIEIERPADLLAYVGKEIGISDWLTVDQGTIDKFADATGDHQWIHVDVERAKREMPGGRTIAHGYLTLSLVPRMSQTIYRVKQRSRGLNYGSNRVRFTAPVPADSRIRMRQTIKAVDKIAGGVRITSENTVEVEGESRPALIAETISMMFD
jgi:acyl dehydratase